MDAEQSLIVQNWNVLTHKMKNLSPEVKLLTNGLWDIPLSQSTARQQQALTVVQLIKTKMELAQFLHGAAFSPVPSTFTKAIQNGIFLTWPGLTPLLIIIIMKEYSLISFYNKSNQLPVRLFCATTSLEILTSMTPYTHNLTDVRW